MTSISGLVLRDLGARVGAFHVSAVNLTVAPGEILAVVGPSGCGKAHFSTRLPECDAPVVLYSSMTTTSAISRRNSERPHLCCNLPCCFRNDGAGERRLWT